MSAAMEEMGSMPEFEQPPFCLTEDMFDAAMFNLLQSCNSNGDTDEPSTITVQEETSHGDKECNNMLSTLAGEFGKAINQSQVIKGEDKEGNFGKAVDQCEVIRREDNAGTVRSESINSVNGNTTEPVVNAHYGQECVSAVTLRENGVNCPQLSQVNVNGIDGNRASVGSNDVIYVLSTSVKPSNDTASSSRPEVINIDGAEMYEECSSNEVPQILRGLDLIKKVTTTNAATVPVVNNNSTEVVVAVDQKGTQKYNQAVMVMPATSVPRVNNVTSTAFSKPVVAKAASPPVFTSIGGSRGVSSVGGTITLNNGANQNFVTYSTWRNSHNPKTSLKTVSVSQALLKTNSLANKTQVGSKKLFCIPLNKVQGVAKDQVTTLINRRPVMTTTAITKSLGAAHRTGTEMTQEELSRLLKQHLPSYKPPDSTPLLGTYLCFECNDRFVLESSLTFHKQRRSILINYQCPQCKSTFQLFNRCSLLGHLRIHGLTLQAINPKNLTIGMLPVWLFELGLKPHMTKEIGTTHSTVMMQPSGMTQPKDGIVISHVKCSLGTGSQGFKKLVIPYTMNAAQLPVDASTITMNSSKVNKDDASKSTRDNSTQLVSLNDVNAMPAMAPNIMYEVPESEIAKTMISVNNPNINVDNQLERNEHAYALAATSSNENSFTVACNAESNLAVVSNTESSLTVSVPKQHVAKTSSNGEVLNFQCTECMETVSDLAAHFIGENVPNNIFLRCKICFLILPTSCSLISHVRIHMKSEPCVCPDCGIDFSSRDDLESHMKTICPHLHKVVCHPCYLCTQLFPSKVTLEMHFMSYHSKAVYKCDECPVAFYRPDAIARHKAAEHNGKSSEHLYYRQCKMCPDRLIPAKKFMLHTQGHAKKGSSMGSYAYTCKTCDNYFLNRIPFLHHLKSCPCNSEIKGKGHMARKGNVAEEVMNQITGVEEEETQLENTIEVEFVKAVEPAQETDPLSLEGFKVNKNRNVACVATCIMCQEEPVVIVPNDPDSSQCCENCVMPCGQQTEEQQALTNCIQCRLCKAVLSRKYKTIQIHFKNHHGKLSHMHDLLRFVTITSREVIKEEINLLKRQAVVELEQMDGTPPPKINNINDEYIYDQLQNHLVNGKSKCHKKKPIGEVNSNLDGLTFDSGQMITDDCDEVRLTCVKCCYASENPEELRSHMFEHKADPSSFQCLECGEEFVVQRSLEMHLVVKHGIKDVPAYLKIWDWSNRPRPFPSDPNAKQCEVCFKCFGGQSDLDKHFRTHGMAFLQRRTQP